METSFDRLRMQLWPLALFAFFLWVATPAESRAKPEPEPERRPPPQPPPQQPPEPQAGGLPRYRGGRE
jgi:hypothetical protein